MIRYTLKCSAGHQFESWFANAEKYETLKAAGHVACAICGDTSVEKSLMAPAVAPKGEVTLAGETSPQEEALKQMREHIEANSDYVGRDFASTARAIHDGEAPDRMIHGEASLDEAKSLLEDGVPVAPLPFGGPKRAN